MQADDFKTQWYYLDHERTIQGPFDTEQMYEWYVSGYFPLDLLVRKDLEKDFYELKHFLTFINNENAPFKENHFIPVSQSPSYQKLNDDRYMRCPNGHIHRIKSLYLLSVLMNEKPGKIWPKEILDDEIMDPLSTAVANLWPCMVSACPVAISSESANKTIDDAVEQDDKYKNLLDKIKQLENQISLLDVSSLMKNELLKPNKLSVSPPRDSNMNCPVNYERIISYSKENVRETFSEMYRNSLLRSEVRNWNSQINSSINNICGQIVDITGQILSKNYQTPTITTPLIFIQPKLANGFFKNQPKTYFPTFRAKFGHVDIEIMVDFNLNKSVFNLQCSAIISNNFVKYVDMSLTEKLKAKQWLQNSNTLRFLFDQNIFDISFDYMSAINIPPYLLIFWSRGPLLFLGNDFLEKHDVYWSFDCRFVFLKHQSGVRCRMNSEAFTVVNDTVKSIK